MNPRHDDSPQDPVPVDPLFDLTLGGHAHAPGPRDAEEKPYNLSMYLDFLPGTD